MTLTNKTLPAVILPRLNEQQREIYTVMQQLKGNKPYLWEGIYNGGEDTGPSYEIPGEALDDPAFAALMEEATKYIGWPYVWGGSSPSTSFDCSGFVCWVYTASGVHNLPRTTAQGIYNQCAIISPSEAKPGDIIFFTGTYDSPGPVSHVGIYVGDGMMLHCGSPIQYANINSSYWQTHYHAVVKHTELGPEGVYRYYSTQRPVDIGTYPKPPDNQPLSIVNYDDDRRRPVADGRLMAWGELTYAKPLTEKQMEDYELKPAPGNPDRVRPSITARLKDGTRGQEPPKEPGQRRSHKNHEER